MQKEDIKLVCVMGKSGVGKQPRIDVLKDIFGFSQLSTGDLFRERMRLYKDLQFQGESSEFWDSENDTFKPDAVLLDLLRTRSQGTFPEDRADSVLLGLKATFYVDNGLFVPDELTNAIFRDAFSKLNFQNAVLDGFPRTIPQFEFLQGLLREHGTSVGFVLQVDWEDDLIVRRATGRRLCRDCGEVHHLMFKPPRDGKYCLKCGGEVYQRTDDGSEEKLRSRLNEFRVKVEPLIAHMREQGIPFASCSGNLEVFTPENLRRQVTDAIGPLVQGEL
eukprot:gnl/Trimastix_PCT/659.p2 GENE.gnl/Trimastix_PCT/659~~gnl/Trimastix_PCT/659.p2  ORF type:complete len:290 (+),score=99.96 gnl/Trimastix_PCT/659:43-870(+)